MRHLDHLHRSHRLQLSRDQSAVIGLQVFERLDRLDLPDLVIELLLEHPLELHFHEISALALRHLGNDRLRSPERTSLLAVMGVRALERVLAAIER